MEWLKKVMQDAAMGLVERIDALVPGLPPELEQACAVIQQKAGEWSFLDWIVPYWALGLCLGMVVMCVLTAIAIRVFRIAVSASSGGGGA